MTQTSWEYAHEPKLNFSHAMPGDEPGTAHAMPGEPGTAHPDVLRAQLAAAYLKLAALQLNFHARDFWRMRAASRTPPRTNYQYIAWHGPDGTRLPAFMRGTGRSLAASSPATLPL